jgi:hypothetical protein
MSSLLAKIGLPSAIGIYLDGGTVYVSQAVAGPFGAVEVARHSETGEPDQLLNTLEQQLARLPGCRGLSYTRVAIGIANERTYFSTRPVQAAGADATAQVLLREALRSSNVAVDDMVVDVIKRQPDNRPVASLVSCKKSYVEPLINATKDHRIHLVRMEPAASALLRTAAKKHRARRGAKIVLRIFLGADRILAVLAANNLPVVWRQFNLPRGDEASAIVSAARALSTVGGHCGIDSNLGAVMVHGRADLQRLVDLGWIEKTTGTAVQWFDDPALEGPDIAQGVACGALREREPGFDLSQSLKPRVSLWALFPLREASLQMALLVLLGLFLFFRSKDLERAHAEIVTQNATNSVALLPVAELNKEKSELLQKVTAVHKFLDTRVSWTSYARDLTERLPDNVFLTSFQGDCELPSSSKKGRTVKPKKGLVLRGAVSIPHDGLIPYEIDRLLATLREHEMLKRDFPEIELADLKQFKRAADANAQAIFTVVCLPKSRKK